ncbi:hypothetical protein LUZ60_002682 [Juncus effusus]|nr:hypothetical protein LUZ60_002682 [Juncus effusus]
MNNNTPITARRRRDALDALGIAEKLLEARDIDGCKSFIADAVTLDPLVPGAEEIVAAAEVLLAAKTLAVNDRPDFYAVLGLDSNLQSSLDPAAVALHYQRLSMILHREVSTPAFSDAARSVQEAWTILSDPPSKALYDRELELARKPKTPPLPPPPSNPISPPKPKSPTPSKPPQSSPKPSKPQSPKPSKPPKIQSSSTKKEKRPNFWTMCTTCCHVHLYGHLCEGQYLLCHSCNRPFFASAMAEPPPIVPDSDMYYCSWGFFPLGFPGGPGYGGMVGQAPVTVPPIPAGQIGEENGTLNTELVRRGRGRPKKNKTSPNIHNSDKARVTVPVVTTPSSEPVRRSRGRPPKIGRTDMQISPVPLQVQEQALVPVAQSEPVRKGRGRPPKVGRTDMQISPVPVQVSVQTPVLVQEQGLVPVTDSEPVRRGRGRPKKSESDKRRVNADRKKVMIDIN